MVISLYKPIPVSPVPTHSGANSSAWFGRYPMMGPRADPQSLLIFSHPNFTEPASSLVSDPRRQDSVILPLSVVHDLFG